MDKFQLKDRAKVLRDAIEIAQTTFVFDANIAEYQKELEKLEKECSHEFLDGTCIWCGKGVKR